MIVRKTTEKDMELLVQLRMAYLLDQNKEETTENEKQLINNLYAYFEKAIMRNEFIAVVAEDEEKAVSTAFMSIAERPPRPGSSPNRVGTIYSVYTDPEYRRRGIATKVLQLLLQEAKENDVATVDLSATADGKALYSPEEVMEWLEENKPKEELALSHGDYCLPNVFFKDGKVSGFIDLGASGVADKYLDIADCYWSLKHNFNGFFGGKAYTNFDPSILFEKLGPEIDVKKVQYILFIYHLAYKYTSDTYLM